MKKRREKIITQIAAAIVSSIQTEEHYQRIKQIAKSNNMTLSQWIAHVSTKQANDIILTNIN